MCECVISPHINMSSTGVGNLYLPSRDHSKALHFLILQVLIDQSIQPSRNIAAYDVYVLPSDPSFARQQVMKPVSKWVLIPRRGE